MYIPALLSNEQKNECWNRCDICGKFIAYKDFMCGATHMMIYPESELTWETWETKCIKCNKKKRNHETMNDRIEQLVEILNGENAISMLDILNMYYDFPKHTFYLNELERCEIDKEFTYSDQMLKYTENGIIFNFIDGNNNILVVVTDDKEDAEAMAEMEEADRIQVIKNVYPDSSDEELAILAKDAYKNVAGERLVLLKVFYFDADFLVQFNQTGFLARLNSINLADIILTDIFNGDAYQMLNIEDDGNGTITTGDNDYSDEFIEFQLSIIKFLTNFNTTANSLN